MHTNQSQTSSYSLQQEMMPNPNLNVKQEMMPNTNLSVNGIQQRRANVQDGAGDSSENQMDRTKLIVNYIPQMATEDELAVIFGTVGQVENIRIMRDFRTGYSYGFGFVKYANAEFAAKAIETINGMNFRNKRLKVAYSRPPGQVMKDSNLYVTNLPRSVTECDIDDLFTQFGEIIQRTILKDKYTGLPRGVAFVRFAKSEDAQAAINGLDGKQLENSLLPLSVRVAEDHGRQKAHMNQACIHARGFKPLCSRSLPVFRELPVPRGNFMPRGNCIYPNYYMNRFMGMGAGDHPFQASIFW